jgi:hypothetical protein
MYRVDQQLGIFWYYVAGFSECLDACNFCDNRARTTGDTHRVQKTDWNGDDFIDWTTIYWSVTIEETIKCDQFNWKKEGF